MVKREGLPPIDEGTTPLPIETQRPLRIAATVVIELIRNMVPEQHQSIAFQALGSSMLVLAKTAKEKYGT